MKTPLTDALAGIKDFRKNVDKILIDESAKDLDKIEALNREALLEGKNTKGNLITPSYLNDPYFKTKEAAQRYSKWKDEISPSTSRPSGTPNLYINGQFHSSIMFEKKGKAIEGSSSSDIAFDINGKYRGEIIGLNPEKTGVFIEKYLLTRVQARLSEAIGL